MMAYFGKGNTLEMVAEVECKKGSEPILGLKIHWIKFLNRASKVVRNRTFRGKFVIKWR